MKINLLVIRTPNPKALAQFYEKLGLQFDYHRHGKGPYHYTTQINEIIFEIYPLMKNQTQADHTLRLGFTVSDLDQLINNLKNNEVEIVSEPQQYEWGYVAIIKDLDGRKIELKNKV